jgi:release factor H-coupled RctB family protein
MRSECEARLSKRYTIAQLAKTALGSRVICNHKGLIFEEAPEAYKPIDSIIDSLLDMGLIRLIARLKPLVSYKTSGGCCA